MFVQVDVLYLMSDVLVVGAQWSVLSGEWSLVPKPRGVYIFIGIHTRLRLYALELWRVLYDIYVCVTQRARSASTCTSTAKYIYNTTPITNREHADRGAAQRETNTHTD